MGIRSRWPGLMLAGVMMLAGGCGWQRAEVSLVCPAKPGPAVQFGLRTLAEALERKGLACRAVGTVERARGRWLVLVGRRGDGGPVWGPLRSAGLVLPDGPEALAVGRATVGGRPAVLVAGSDERGLMYGLLDVAERVGWTGRADPPFQAVRRTVEQPDVPERAVSIYTMNRAYWESRFYDRQYWQRYCAMLARCRFNRLVVIFGYENGGFLAPAYPYFFDLPQFPQVRMVGITAGQQKRNLEALNHLIAIAHAHGVKVTVGFWDHIYRGGVQGGGVPQADRGTRQPTRHRVWGVTAENLVAYTQAALAHFVQVVPDLDGIQFRMHWESGLKRSEQEGFWREVFEQMKRTAPHLRLDLRAKGLPDAVIDQAVEAGVRFRITTKYWMEQMGLPFHPTHINVQNQHDRRHSYADLLRYPRRYAIHWRLWNGGTSRVLLWGDPDYARRFADSTHLYDGQGFEVNEPLCTKMEAQPHDARPFDLMAPRYRYYRYEFERYWHFFQVFGRLGYDRHTPGEVWDRQFARRFGRAAGPHLERALHQASRILPRIVGACYPYRYFPMTRGWAEKQRLGDLPFYARAEGSDIAQFASFDQEAQLLLEGGQTAKVRPPVTSRWFEQTAATVLAEVAEAERAAGSHRSREFDSTVVDLKMLAHLGRYHARRIPAAVNYRLFERTGDPAALDRAIACESQAIAAWRDLVESAGEVYAADLMMGARVAGLCGHWRDELAALEKGLAALKQRRAALGDAVPQRQAPRYRPVPDRGDTRPPQVRHEPVEAAPAGRPLTVRVQVSDPSGVQWVRLRYRSVTQMQDYRSLEMKPSASGRVYAATIPAGHVDATYDLMYYIEVMDRAGNGGIWPDLNERTPYIVVRLQR